MIRAVIFDRDGVILDSESINVISSIKAFKELGISITEDEKELIIGRHPDDYIKTFLEKHDFSYDEFRKIQRKTYYELLESAPFFDKTISFIKKLHKIKIPIALTTSSSRTSTLLILKKANLEDVFDVIVTSEDYDKRKPDPESYIITAKKLNVNQKDCLVIEDSFAGVEAAKNAGMKCIAVPNKVTKHQDFSKADLVVNSLEEININTIKNL